MKKRLLTLSFLLIPNIVFAKTNSSFSDVLPTIFTLSIFIIFFTGIFIKAIKMSNNKIKDATNNENNSISVDESSLLKCPACGAPIQKEAKVCEYCKTAITNVDVNNVPLVDSVSYDGFDDIYKNNEDVMVTMIIKKHLSSAGIDLSTKKMPFEIARRKKVLNIILCILLFVFVSMIFFHFPIITYILGIMLFMILFIANRKYNLIKYIHKQLKSRPNEKISNVVMNLKNDFVDVNNTIYIFAAIIAIILPLIIFMNPKIIYEHTDNGYAVRYYIYGWKNYTKVEIPSTYKDEKIVSIRGNGFSNMFFLKEAILPDTITEIRGQAFKNDYKLTKVVLPEKLTYLGGGSFYNCISLKEIELPNTITYLGGEAFKNAKSLRKVNIPNKLTEIRGNTFENCESLNRIVIPDSVTRIGGHAFYGNTNLAVVQISASSSLTEIGSSAFRNCSSLTKIYVPENVNINGRAFKNSPTTVTRNTDASIDYRITINNNDLYSNYFYVAETQFLLNQRVRMTLPGDNNIIIESYLSSYDYTHQSAELVITINDAGETMTKNIHIDSNKDEYQISDELLVIIKNYDSYGLEVEIYYN